MSLQRDLGAAVKEAVTGQRRCTVCDALAVMKGDDGVSLRAALNSPLGAKRLAGILQQNRIPVGVPSITKHRSEGHQ